MKKSLFSLLLAGASILAFASCSKKPKDEDKVVSEINENTALVFSTQELDGVFNPFFSTSGTDSAVVGMTQISMLGNDKDGNVTYGKDEPVVVLDYEITTEGIPNVDQITTYKFVLKNNVKFSNGSPLTMRDVLFNLYVYLDAAYAGSSTIYSTDIVGLKEYRTQEANEDEQNNFMHQFQIAAETRIDDLISAAEEIFEEDDNYTEASFRAKLDELSKEASGNNRKHLVEDFDKAIELFKEELNSDYNNAVGTAEDISYKNKAGQVIKPFKTDVEAFLYNEGYIKYNKDIDGLESAFGAVSDLKTWTKERAIETIYKTKVPTNIAEIVTYWATASNLYEYLTGVALQEHFAGVTNRQYPNISGITFANKDTSVDVNGKTYKKVEYQSDNLTPKEDCNEVLSIKIHDVDPKAIWNFAFTVAPMYYYSDQEHINKFDYVSNFGVEWNSIDFMNKVVKNPDKIGVPVGAGAYQASKSAGGTENIGAGDFYEKGIVYYERNPYFLMGAPIIKKVRFKVVPQNSMTNALYNGEIDFAEPNAKPELIEELNGKKSQGIENQQIQTSGYGYVGINAGKVPSIEVRQAIMHTVDTQECINYYKTTAKAIYRPISLSSWAYPEGVLPYYPFIGGAIPNGFDADGACNPAYVQYVKSCGLKAGEKMSENQQHEFIKMLVEDGDHSGYRLVNGIYQRGSSGDKLEYTFTVAGNETDHPAWQALFKSGEMLNKWGFKIEVKTDAQALRKLANGSLTVWAAAWSSTIDPDMYQVYHMDSKATSVNNWGYRQILGNTTKYPAENNLIAQLSEYIDLGRTTNDQTQRKSIYKEALDLVMQLAVELPTYQRNDLYAYNSNKIDKSTLTPESELTPYNGLTNQNWLIRLNEEK